MISVVIPNYNNMEYIEACIHSCLQQEKVSEVIIVDDASTDGSLKQIKKLEEKYQEVILMESSGIKNKGAAYCRNLGIQKASGKYIAFLDSDDIYEDNRFNLALKILEKDLIVDGVYDNVWSYDNELDSRKPTLDICMPLDLPPNALFEHLLFDGNTFISIIGLTLKAEIAKQYAMDTSLQIGEDSDYIWNIALNHTLVHSRSETALIKRRVHEHNITSNKDLWDQNRAKLFKKWYDLRKQKGLSKTVSWHFRKKQIHYQGKSMGTLNLPYKAFKYFTSLLGNPGFISLLFK